MLLSGSTLLLAFLGLFAPGIAQDAEEVNPFLDAAKNMIQESLASNPEGVASLVKGLMDGEAGKHIGDLLGRPGVVSDLMEAFTSAGVGGSQGGEGLGGLDSLASLLPLLSQSGHEHHDDPEEENVAEHEEHDRITSMFPPIIEHYFKMATESEIGKTLWEGSGLKSTFDLFTDPEGHLKLESALKSLENPLFRKRWLRSLVGFVAHWVKHLSHPETQRRYMINAATTANGLMRSNGISKTDIFRKDVLFEESLVQAINLVFKKRLGMPVDSAAYVKPVFKYVNDLMLIGRGSMSQLSTKQIEDQLAETLNAELIEGILRVWRAHKYALQVHSCDSYLLCELNRPEHHTNYTIRPGITKLSSVVSAWFLSGRTGTPFWKLYNAASSDYDCKKMFPVNCDGFHEEDTRATTEYAHTEL